VTSSGNLTLGGTLDLSSPPTIGNTAPNTGRFTTLTVDDNTTLGSSNSDTVTFNARINSDFDPAVDNAYDLGRTGHEWRNLYIDGTANIDSLIADTADINAGTIDNTSIGASTASTGTFTTLTATADSAFTSTGSVTISKGTTAQRPGSPVGGMLRFNDDLDKFEGYNGTAWSSVGGGATGGGSDDVFYENGQNVTANYTITSGKNAMSAGPITVDSGVTVTVPSGSVWTIV
jgi:hypothetical protein